MTSEAMTARMEECTGVDGNDLDVMSGTLVNDRVVPVPAFPVGAGAVACILPVLNELRRKEETVRSRFFVIALLVSVLGAGASPARAMQALGAWEVVPSPNTGSPHNQLNGVAAIAHDDAWAVGAYGVFEVDGPRQMIQHWDGTRWALAASPVPEAPSELLAVSAVGAADIWAVGGYGTGGEALIQHWDGTAWSVVGHPNPGGFNRFYGVAARASDDVWAVGLQHDGGLQKTLVEHWDGSSWTVVPAPTSQGSTTSSIP